jgi:hypothetical protein
VLWSACLVTLAFGNAILADNISLTAGQIEAKFGTLYRREVHINACITIAIRLFGKFIVIFFSSFACDIMKNEHNNLVERLNVSRIMPIDADLMSNRSQIVTELLSASQL